MKYLIPLQRVTLSFAALVFVLCALHFPRDVDSPQTPREIEQARAFYADAYRRSVAANESQPAIETEYLRAAEFEAEHFGVKSQIREFAERYNLQRKRVLEIGSGRGYLQDIVSDYTGLDISPSVARFYHKKFVLGSATALPFPDNAFDAIWSIWVLEHVPNPEQSLVEARRVTRSGGVIYLAPAWVAAPWAAEGYEVRPYSDFDLAGKIIKASIVVRSLPEFRALSLIPVRAFRALSALSGPTRLRYQRLTPNYEIYWVNDSDAVNSIDRHEAMLWFQSRGDECLNCESQALVMGFGPLVIRVNKGG